MTLPVVVALDSGVRPHELVVFLQRCGNTGWGVGTESNWSQCLAQSLGVVTARNARGDLAGVGFLVGNVRHAELVDVSVGPDYQGHGVGRRLIAALVAEARRRGIRYLNLVTDPDRPWLIEWYRSQGFARIDAMSYTGQTWSGPRPSGRGDPRDDPA